MEEALLGQKQIRHYFKQFSEQQWNRLAKATMMLGVQQLMFENKKELFWDFSQLSLDHIEDIVVENEIKLIQRQREMRAQSKDKKQSFIPMEKVSGILSVVKDEPQVSVVQNFSSEVDKKPKKVTVVVSESVSNLDEDQSSVVPQLSNSIKKRRLSDPSPIKQAIKNKNEIQKNDVVDAEKLNKENYQVHVNRRHQLEFNKHKSSQNMSQLLKADETVQKRQQRMVSGLKNSRQQPSQKEKSSLRTNIHQNVQSGEQIVNKLPQSQNQEKSVPREGSRDPSYGRPSSRWRQGVSINDNLSKLDEEFINFELQNKNKGMVYPSWWQTQDDDQFQIAGSVDNSQEIYMQQKKTKNNEDSLDVRLRQVREVVEQKNNFHDRNGKSQFDQRQNQNQGQVSPQNRNGHKFQKQQNLKYKGDLQNEQSFQDNQYPSFDQQNIAIQQSKSSLPSPNSSSHIKQIMASSSTNVLNLLDSAYAANMNQMAANQRLSRTNESVGSFAYTKGTPKYSPVRDRNPGNQNIPMSYSGPPTQNEINRDANRHMSGNRNFSQTVSQEQSQRVQNNKAAMIANKLAQNQNRQNQPSFQKNNQRFMHQQQNIGQKNIIDSHQVFLEQQREAERNRMNVQKILQQNEKNEYSNQSLDDENYINGQGQQHINNGNSSFQNRNQNDDQGMQKFAKGGVSMTISANVTQEDRSRSGSKPKYPFMDQEPFRGNGVPLRKRNEQSKQGANRQSNNQKFSLSNAFYGSGNYQQSQNQRKIPKELNNIESSIKSKIDYDRRVYQERQRLNEIKDYQNKNYGRDLGVTQSLNTDVNNSEGANIQKMVNSSSFQEGENRSLPQTQIFYKRDDKTLIYEEGVDDSYRGDNQSSYYQNYSQTKDNQQQYLNAQNRRAMMNGSVQQSSQLHDSASSQRQNIVSEHPQNIYYDDFQGGGQVGQNQNNYEVQKIMEGATLRRRTISPSTQKAIQSDQYDVKNLNNNNSYLNGGKQQRGQYPQENNQMQNQLPIELYAQQRQSFVGVEDQHNETGFTQKLFNQQRINPSISYTNLDQSNLPSSATNARKIQEQQNQVYKQDQVFESNYAKNNLRNDQRSILNQVPPPSSFNKGYYDQNGDFHADQQNLKNKQKNNKKKIENAQRNDGGKHGQINKWQQQIRDGNDKREVVDEESSYTEGGGEGGEAIPSDSENKNNTSRFAFGSGDEQINNYSLQHYKAGFMQQQRNQNYGRFHRPQNQYQNQAENEYYPQKSGTIEVRNNNNSIVLQQYRGQNISAEQSSSFINPNISIGEAHGVEKGQLKNQLEQMLMMKSGEFSAGRAQNNEILLSSVGTASLGNDVSNSSGLQSAPRPDASAYHQYAFVNYKPQLPISKYAQQQEQQLNYSNNQSQNYLQPNSLENHKNFKLSQFDKQDYSKNINERAYYQDKFNPQQIQEQAALKSSIKDYHQLNYQPAHQAGYQNYQNQQKPYLQNQDNKYVANEVRQANKFEVPYPATGPYDQFKVQQISTVQNAQKSQNNFNTSEFAQSQKDRVGFLNSNEYQYKNRDVQNTSKYAVDQQFLSGPSQNNSFQHSQASANYKRTNLVSANYDNKYAQKEIHLAAQPTNQSYKQDIYKQGNNFTLQRPSVDEKNNVLRSELHNNYYLDNSRISIPSNRGKSNSPPKQNQAQVRNTQLDYRIGSGKRDQKQIINNANNNEINGQAPPNSNYYQTFNQNKVQKNQSQQDQQTQNINQRQDEYENNEIQDFGEGDEEDEGEDYGNMDGGEDMEGTSQMSPDQPIDGRMTQSQIQNGDDSMAYENADNETKTENLRNFMEQAQPGNVLINSQGLSQQGATPNQQAESRKMTVPNAYATSYNGASKNGSQSQFDQPSGRTEDKEGGSIDEMQAQQLLAQQQYNFNRNYQEQEKFQNRLQNQYAGLAAAVQQRHGAFISSGNFKEDERKRDTSEESSPEISQTEQTSQIVTTNKKKADEFTNDDDISSSFQETPLGENTNSLSGTNTGAKNNNQREQVNHQGSQNVYQQIISDDQLQNNMQKVRKLTEKLAQMGNVSNNKNVAVCQDSCDSQTNEVREGTVQNTNTQSVSMSEPNKKRKQGQISADSDESLSPLRDSEL